MSKTNGWQESGMPPARKAGKLGVATLSDSELLAIFLGRVLGRGVNLEGW